MAQKTQPRQGGTGKTGESTKRDSRIGDSKGSMENLQKAMEIPPKSGSVGKTEK